jgi:hypothetical protein
MHWRRIVFPRLFIPFLVLELSTAELVLFSNNLRASFHWRRYEYQQEKMQSDAETPMAPSLSGKHRQNKLNVRV